MDQKQITAKKVAISVFDPAPGDMVLDPATKHTLHPGPGALRSGLLPSLGRARSRACSRVCPDRMQDAQWEEAHDLQEQSADSKHASGVRLAR
jgi:hypothetical protein